MEPLYFLLANGLTNADVFQPKRFLNPREIIPQNYSSSGLVILEELGNNQTNRQTHWHTFAFIEGYEEYGDQIIEGSSVNALVFLFSW